MSTPRAIETFIEQYRYLNNETLEAATRSKPELVKGIVLDEDIRLLARAYALYHLGVGAREEYFSFIKGFTDNPSALIRESAFMSLFEYYDRDENKHLDLEIFFERKMREEKELGVKQKISELLGNMHI